MVTLPRLDWIKNTTLQISNYNRFGVWFGLVSTEVKKEPSKILFSNGDEAHFIFQQLNFHILRHALTIHTIKGNF
jgi:hypothetical protein